MSAIGRVAGSFFSAVNENVAALANFNFDFALVKFEAPKEFLAVGQALSSHRRNDAEEGPIHKTARRLGALFEDLVPPTPQLIKAYGLRASQIASSPVANPRGSADHGPFAEFVGADGTSLWAAATSSRNNVAVHAPLAMHLLGCLLARAWEPEEAVSIWVEIVAERQKWIEETMDDNQPQPVSSYLATKQKISRKQLALWDASARAWLRSADEARAVEKTKLMLILKNISISVSEGHHKSYDNVIEAWRQAMIGMEKVVKGTPQEVSNGSILLALSAWHIHPDLIVLGHRSQVVEFKDEVVQKGGTITIGLQFASEKRAAGMRWSLSLSHLRYYDDNVKVESKGDVPRFTFDQLLITAFGGLLAHWAISKKDEMVFAQLLSTIKHCFSKHLIHNSFRWLSSAAEAAIRYLTIAKTDIDMCHVYTALGRRKGRRFLGLESDAIDNRPLFGLLNQNVQRALEAENGFEAGIRYFRGIAAEMGLRSGDAIIRFVNKQQRSTHYEYATAVAQKKISHKRSLDGSPKIEVAHCRWLLVETRPAHRYETCMCKNWCRQDCRCATFEGVCSEECHPGQLLLCQRQAFTFDNRRAQVSNMGELCHYASSRYLSNGNTGDTLARPTHALRENPSASIFWRNPPPMFHSHTEEGEVDTCCLSCQEQSHQCVCFDPCFRNSAGKHEERFEMCAGDRDQLALFVRMTSDTDLPGLRRRSASAIISKSKLEDSVSYFSGPRLNQSLLTTYLETVGSPSMQSSNFTHLLSFRDRSGLITLAGQSDIEFQLNVSLGVLDQATGIYDHLPGATIPLKILSFSLHQSNFVRISDFSGNGKRIQATKSSVDSDGAVSGDGGGDRDDYADEVDSDEDGGDTDIEFQPPRSRPILPHMMNRPDELIDMTRAQLIACVILFESGIHNVSYEACKDVIAIASANSIFILAELLSDPVVETTSLGGIRRIIGNIGKPGMSLMVLPQRAPRIQNHEEIFIVSHPEYDNKREDNFRSTSLHLSFTAWQRPLNTAARGTIDESLNYVESVVSVHDRGNWVADLDIMKSKIIGSLKWTSQCSCSGNGDSEAPASIDDWDGLLEPPDNIGIFRAHGNWAARLAATSIRAQMGKAGFTYVLGPEDKICNKCVSAAFIEQTGSRRGVIID